MEELTSWNCFTSEREKTPEKVLNFVNEIDEVCKKYNLSISHEDCHGAFELEIYSAHNIKWLRAANLNYPSANHKKEN